MRALVWMLAALAACDGAAQTLTLERATPNHAPLAGGTTLTLTGTGFLAGAPNRVLIASREAPLARVVDDTTLEVVAPPGERPGDAEVVVINSNGNARATAILHYSGPPTIGAVTPDDVLFMSTTAVLTLTGTGFLDEGAGTVNVLVDGVLATDVQVISDSSLTFVAPPGPALVRPAIEVIDERGSATKSRGFRYVPSERPGLILFSSSFQDFATYFDPTDLSTVTIPLTAPSPVRFTAVVRDELGDYWGVDRNRRLGRIDMRTQKVLQPLALQAWYPTLTRVGNEYYGLERNTRRFGEVDLSTGVFTSLGASALPCCGSHGLAYDGTTIYFTARSGTGATIATIDPASGIPGTAVPIIAAPGFSIEEMRFFNGTLYASSRDGTLVTLDPITGVTTVLPINLGRFQAIELFE